MSRWITPLTYYDEKQGDMLVADMLAVLKEILPSIELRDGDIDHLELVHKIQDVIARAEGKVSPKRQS